MMLKYLVLLVLLSSLSNSDLTEDIQDLEAQLEEIYNDSNVDNSVEAMEERFSVLYNQEGEERQGAAAKNAEKSKKKKKGKKFGTDIS